MGQEQRKATRRRTRRLATVKVGNDLLYGTVLDVSGEGAFFRPEWGMVNGALEPMTRPLESFHAEEQVELNVVEANKEEQARAVVRWVGCSNEHWSHGVGLELRRG